MMATFQFPPGRRAITAALLLALFSAAVQTLPAGDKKQPPAKSPKRLVWPLPPDKPRIEFVAIIRGASDVESVKGPNLLDRIAGIQRKQYKPSLVKPYGVATDSKGRIYVADSAQGIVFVLDRANKKVTYIGRGMQMPLRVPIGVTVDNGDRVWVADAFGQHVYAFDGDGNILMALGKEGEMLSPTGVAVDDGRKRVYVADSKLHCILLYDSETGSYAGKWGKRGYRLGEFNFPTNVALDRSGRLYVSDTANTRIQIFDPDGNATSSFGSQGDSPGQFLKPKGIALDNFGNVYVVDSDFDNFQIFDSKNRLLMAVGTGGETAGAFWLPAGIHVDRNNYIYVSDQTNQRIQIFKLLDGSVEEPAPTTAPNGSAPKMP